MKIITILSRVIFPEKCLLCGADLIFDKTTNFPVCDMCRAKLLPIDNQYRCHCCSEILISEMDICMRCRGRNYFFQSNRSLFEYSYWIKELIYQYKFKYKKSIAYFWVHLMSTVINNHYNSHIIVPVPASYKSKRKRGWDHMLVLAQLLHKQYGIPYISCLSRAKSKQQKGLDYDARIINLKDKIQCRIPEKIIKKKILLLDDVFTTGATVSECAHVLLHSGAESVDTLTIALD